MLARPVVHPFVSSPGARSQATSPPHSSLENQSLPDPVVCLSLPDLDGNNHAGERVTSSSLGSLITSACDVSGVGDARLAGLLPTPPMNTYEQHSPPVGMENANVAAWDYSRSHSSFGTPPNRVHPLTPDITPPADQLKSLALPYSSDHRLPSSRTDSFKTAHEEQLSPEAEHERPPMPPLDLGLDRGDDRTPKVGHREGRAPPNSAGSTPVADHDQTPTRQPSSYEFMAFDGAWNERSRPHERKGVHVDAPEKNSEGFGQETRPRNTAGLVRERTDLDDATSEGLSPDHDDRDPPKPSDELSKELPGESPTAVRPPNAQVDEQPKTHKRRRIRKKKSNKMDEVVTSTAGDRSTLVPDLLPHLRRVPSNELSLRQRILINRKADRRDSTRQFAETIDWPLAAVDDDDVVVVAKNQASTASIAAMTTIEAMVFVRRPLTRPPLRHAGRNIALAKPAVPPKSPLRTIPAPEVPRSRLVQKPSVLDMKRASLASAGSTGPPPLQSRSLERTPPGSSSDQRLLTEEPSHDDAERRPSPSDDPTSSEFLDWINSRYRSPPTFQRPNAQSVRDHVCKNPLAPTLQARGEGADEVSLRRRTSSTPCLASHQDSYRSHSNHALKGKQHEPSPQRSGRTDEVGLLARPEADSPVGALKGQADRSTAIERRVRKEIPHHDRAPSVGYLTASAAVTSPSQLSSTSTPEALEVSQATAVSIYPHNNHSLLVVQQQAQAVHKGRHKILSEDTGLIKDRFDDVRRGVEQTEDEEEVVVMRSPPTLQVIPPTPSIMSPVQELDEPVEAGKSRRGGFIVRARTGGGGAISLMKRALGNKRYTDGFVSPFARFKDVDESAQTSVSSGHGTGNSHNGSTIGHGRRQPQRLTAVETPRDTKLSPFWRPRGFWDDLDADDSAIREEFLDRGRLEEYVPPTAVQRHRSHSTLSEGYDDRHPIPEHSRSSRPRAGAEPPRLTKDWYHHRPTGRKVYLIKPLGVRVEFVGRKALREQVREN